MFKKIIVRTTLFLLIFGSIGLPAKTQEKGPSTYSLTRWDDLLQKAHQEKKNILIDCYFTGCAPCAMMDKTVFPNVQLKKLMEAQFIFTKVDVLKEEIGMQIMAKYGVSGFPTFLLLNNRGQLLRYWSGFQDVGQMYAQLNIVNQSDNELAVLSGFSNALETTYPLYYQQHYSKENRRTDAKSASEWVQAQADWTKEIPAMTLLKFRKLSPACDSFVLTHYSQLRALYGEPLCLEKALRYWGRV